MLMTIKELAKKLNINETTIRTWLGNYRFEKYRQKNCKPIKYDVGYYFYEDLDNFLELKLSKTAFKLKKKIAPLCSRVDSY